MIKEITDHKNTKVQPGQDVTLSPAASVGDGGWQGDLKIKVIADIPEGFNHIGNPADIDRQLVPGNTWGSRHCLKTLDGVELYWPDGWTHDASYDEYVGPAIKCKEGVTIEHPSHGNVNIPAGFVIGFEYQRAWDAEQKRERRQLD